MKNLLSIKNLSVTFGNNNVVKSADLQISRGEFVALVGESGSGKSVTALSVLQLIPSAKLTGSIKFDGQELMNAPEKILRGVRGKKVGMIFQEPMTSLNPLHTIGKQITEAIEIHSPRQNIPARVTELLEMVELESLKTRLNSYPHQLSGGQRQRVMIAMALANNPDLLIADEPTTALDVIVSGKILRLLKKIQRAQKMAVLLITHDLSIVEKLSDSVYVMKNGELVEHGKTAKVFASPQHEYTKFLLASSPKGRAVKASPAPVPVIRTQNLSVSFARNSSFSGIKKSEFLAVKNVSVTIPEGKTIGLVGESGSGKTTLGMAILCLVNSTGDIGFMGSRISKLSKTEMRPLRKSLQVVFQDPFSSLNPRMTVEQIISEGLAAHNQKADIIKILEEVGLSAEMANRYPHEFSGGQRQRIGIARAIALKPKFILLDEPTSALDVSVQSQILDLLKNLQSKYKISYLFVSHDLRVIRSIAHEIGVMQNGEIVEYGSTEQILEKPKNKYTKELVEAALLV